jgi:hypothetical protein
MFVDKITGLVQYYKSLIVKWAAFCILKLLSYVKMFRSINKKKMAAPSDHLFINE